VVKITAARVGFNHVAKYARDANSC